MRVLPRMNKQGCLFYPKRTSKDACSTQNEQAGMRVLPNESAIRNPQSIRRGSEYCRAAIRNPQSAIRNSQFFIAVA
ncbi:MAG: hypothetical protein ACPGWR_24175 [Ardenticatenaceae bacterium]